jgi:O-acetyl-ADP-ribose deacetylase (regulator of RNase III)
VEVEDAPLTACGAEALLRPIRTDWAAITADARSLEVAAGEAWRSRCEEQGELPLGSAAITDAGELDAEFVVHLAVSPEEGGPTPRSVTLALQNGLRRAREWDVRDLALPLLGTGPGALDAETSCRLMAPELADFVAGGDRRVRVCVPDPALREVARGWWGDVSR